MKLYKFRPLGNKTDFERAKRILTTGKFWCSRFSELNDPMEGVFFTTDTSIIGRTFGEKNKYKICSFSGSKAFKNPALWGYYANGFKGIAIEVEIDDNKVKPIKYNDEIKLINRSSERNEVEKILLSKLKCWSPENEYRFLIKSTENEHAIGNITAVYLGKPYDVYNRRQIYQHSHMLRRYQRYVKRLKDIVRNVHFCDIEIKDGKVKAKSVKKRK